MVGKHRKNDGKSPCYSWVNPLSLNGHFQVRKLLVNVSHNQSVHNSVIFAGDIYHLF